MFEDAFNNVDWIAFRWALVSCLPFILVVVFLAIHIADIMDDRKIKKSLRARVKALKHGEKAYWDAPKAAPVHYINDECEHGTDFAFECEACNKND